MTDESETDESEIWRRLEWLERKGQWLESRIAALLYFGSLLASIAIGTLAALVVEEWIKRKWVSTVVFVGAALGSLSIFIGISFKGEPAGAWPVHGEGPRPGQ
jgi:hypothetical protein